MLKENTKNYPLLIIFLLLLTSGEFLWVFLHFVHQKSETDRAIIFGFSGLKILLLFILLLIVLGGLSLTILLIRKDPLGMQFEQAIKKKKTAGKLLRFFGTTGSVCWVTFFLSPTYFRGLENILSLARPLVLLGIFFSFQTIFYLSLSDIKTKIDFLKKSLTTKKTDVLVWMFLVTFFLGISVYIAVSQVGISANQEDFWYETGVPILGLQVALALIIGLLFRRLEPFLEERRVQRIDFKLFLLIWLVSGAIWASTPVPNGFLNPGPYPPTYETYPYADAARYDLMSQTALIGDGLNNGWAYNRPAYPAFLVYIHAISGQNYDANMQLQAALFGIFPALIYLVTSFLSNRFSGIVASSVIIMRGINGILATNLINLANQKQMLTDFPTAIGISAILLFCFFWFQNPKKSYVPLLTGGLFGITLYFRPTILGLLPAIFIMVVLFKGYKQKKRIMMILVFILGIFTFVLPKELTDYASASQYTYPATIKKIISIANSRVLKSEEVSPDKSYDSAQPGQSHQDDKNLVDDESVNQTIESGFIIVEQHFLHNIVTSVLFLPKSLTFNSLKETVKADNSFWRLSWNGHLTREQIVFLIINIALISVGIFTSIKSNGILGYLPLLFFVGYNFVNALARTSGGRYIVPIDWVVVIYFVIGLSQVFYSLSSRTASSISSNYSTSFDDKLPSIPKSMEMLVSVLILILTGCLLVLPDYVFPKRYVSLSQEQLLQDAAQYDLQGKQAYIEEILDSENGIITTGQIMYPRYYPKGKGETSDDFPYKPLEFPRLVFHLIGNGTSEAVIFPGSMSTGLANTGAAIIIGCKEHDYISAAVIIQKYPVESVFFSTPLLDPVCPSSQFQRDAWRTYQ